MSIHWLDKHLSRSSEVLRRFATQLSLNCFHFLLRGRKKLSGNTYVIQWPISVHLQRILNIYYHVKYQGSFINEVLLSLMYVRTTSVSLNEGTVLPREIVVAYNDELFTTKFPEILPLYQRERERAFRHVHQRNRWWICIVVSGNLTSVNSGILKVMLAVDFTRQFWYCILQFAKPTDITYQDNGDRAMSRCGQDRRES